MLHALLFWPFAFWMFGPFHGLFSLLVLILVFGLIFGRRRYYYGYHPYWWHSGGSRSDARCPSSKPATPAAKSSARNISRKSRTLAAKHPR